MGKYNKRRGPRPSVSLDEITIQIALGTLTDPYQIAGFIVVTNDIKAIVWGSKHASSKVREAAAKNPICPFGMLVKLGLLDSSGGVQKAAREALALRKQDFQDFLFVLEEYPQLALPFYHTSRIETAEETSSTPGIDQE